MKRLTIVSMTVVLALLLGFAATAAPARATTEIGIMAVDNCPGGWHRSSFTVRIIAQVSVPLNFVAGIQWWLDSPKVMVTAPPKVMTFYTDVPVACPADHSRDGNHRLYYEAFGSLPGSYCGEYATWIGIDTLAPTTSAASGAENLTLWHNHALTVFLTASDGSSGVSGVKTLSYKIGSPKLWTDVTGSSASVTVSNQAPR